MFNKLAIAGFGLVVLCAPQSWAGTTGNGWTHPAPAAPAAVPAAAAQDSQPQAQPQQTWRLHGRTVSCASTKGWRHSEYVSHCRHS